MERVVLAEIKGRVVQASHTGIRIIANQTCPCLLFSASARRLSAYTPTLTLRLEP